MTNRRNVVYCIVIFVLYLTTSLVLYCDLIINLYPTADEIPLIQSSSKIGTNWISSGFSDYFIIYPEWPAISYSYIRPVVNLLYWIFSPWSINLYKFQMIVTGHVFHAALSTFIFYIAYAFYDRALIHSIALSSLLYFCAAYFDTLMPYLPVYSIECITAILCVLAILSYTHGKYLTCTIMLFIALLTKESALPIIGSLLLYSIIKRRTSVFISIFIVLISWLAIRYYAFEGFGNTASFSSGFRITNFVSTSMLPLAFFNVSTLKGFITDVAVPTNTLIFLFSNIIFWCIFFYITSNDLINRNILHYIISDENKAKQEFRIISFICVMSFLAYVAVTGVTEGRFSYMFVVMLAIYLSSSENKVSNILVIFLLFMSIIGSYISLAKLNRDMIIQKFKSSDELIRTIKSEGKNAKNLYIVNDFSSGCAAPKYQKSFAGASSDITRITSIEVDNCSLEDLGSIETSIRRDDGIYYINTKLPECAIFVFESTDMTKLNIDNDKMIKRGQYLVYSFPEAAYTTEAVSGMTYLYSLGRSAQVTISEDSPVIYYDFKNKKWIKL